MSQTTETGPETSRLPAPDRELGPALQQVAHALRDLHYGTVTIIVQDGIPIQVERTEKKRLRRPAR
ncbi:MAG TPA: YezD family protein [Gemmataceae bacterium]|nr:YezD family protein [Gemmataceae bacterium]